MNMIIIAGQSLFRPENGPDTVAADVDRKYGKTTPDSRVVLANDIMYNIWIELACPIVYCVSGCTTVQLQFTIYMLVGRFRTIRPHAFTTSCAILAHKSVDKLSKSAKVLRSWTFNQISRMCIGVVNTIHPSPITASLIARITINNPLNYTRHCTVHNYFAPTHDCRVRSARVYVWPTTTCLPFCGQPQRARQETPNTLCVCTQTIGVSIIRIESQFQVEVRMCARARVCVCGWTIVSIARVQHSCLCAFIWGRAFDYDVMYCVRLLTHCNSNERIWCRSAGFGQQRVQHIQWTTLAEERTLVCIILL